jgi:hypothetical protein
MYLVDSYNHFHKRLYMRRFVLYHAPDASETSGAGIIAFGCEMWCRGPVALIWTVEPYNQTWLINIDGLDVHRQLRVQPGVTKQATDIVFLDEASDSVLDHLKGLVFGGGSTEDFPTNELQRAFENIAGLRLVRINPPSLAGLSVPQYQ